MTSFILSFQSQITRKSRQLITRATELWELDACPSESWLQILSLAGDAVTQTFEINLSAKLFMTYAVGKLEPALNINHSILSTSSQRVG